MASTSDSASEKIEPGNAEVAKGANGATPLPAVRLDVGAGEALERLEHAAKRGKLPGFECGRVGLFKVDAFGTPFDHDLIATPEPSAEDERRVRFTMRMRPGMPVLLAVVLVLTVEPGRYFLDGLIPGEWGWIDTRWWYYPLTILPIPFIWRVAMQRSRESSLQHAREQIAKVARFAGGEVVEQENGSTVESPERAAAAAKQ